jgi:hypothetical protein
MASCQPQDFIPMFSDLAASIHISILSLGRLRAGSIRITVDRIDRGMRPPGSLASGAVATTREHKMRSFLTILGVIIGTGAVIGVGSIIAGLDDAVAGLLRSFGPNTVLSPRPPPWATPLTKSAAASSLSPKRHSQRPLQGQRRV